MSTRAAVLQQKKDAFTHVMNTVLGFKDDQPMMKAMEELVYNEIDDIATMTQTEIMELEYDSDGQGTMKKVPMKARKLLLHVLWWRDMEAATRASRQVGAEDWLNLTEDRFQTFRDAEAANMARSGTTRVPVTTTSSGTTGTGAVTGREVDNFRKLHKRDPGAYTVFNGDRRYWFRAKRNWKSNASNDGINALLNESYSVPAEGTQARDLYDAQNQYLYNVLQTCVKGGQALVHVRENEDSCDGRETYLAMISFYERKANLSLIKTQCMEELATLRLTRNFPGGPLKFFQQFQNVYLDLENAGKTIVSDDEKIAQLNAALVDPRFSTVRETVETMSLQTGTPVDYSNYLQSLINHAENLSSQAARMKRVAAAEKKKPAQKDRPQRDPDAWRTDKTAYVPLDKWNELTPQEQAARRKAKAEKKRLRRVNATDSSSQMTTSTTPPASEVGTDGTTVASGVTQQTGAPASDGGQQPTFAQIMRTQRLPPGTYTNEDGRTFTINALKTVRISNLDAAADAGAMLIDGGSNSGLAGTNMRLLEQLDEKVNVVGASDCVENGMQNLPVGTYAATLTSALGVRCVGVFPKMIGYGKGKSILSKSQCEAFGFEIYDKARRRGGKQKIVSPDGYVFKMRYKDALMWLDVEYPTDEELDSLPRVYFGSEVWDPDHENDDTDDEAWYDTNDDPDEMNDEEFFDSRDGWFATEEALANPHERTLAATASVKPKIKKKAVDYEKLRPFFAWKPVEVVRKTLQATTQLATNVVRLPLRRHYKSRFPALRVRRLDEDVATDTFFSNTKALDGSTCAQLFVGRKSMLTDIFGMKTESQMPGALMDFIRKWGAGTGLFSDNAKSETSRAVRDILRTYNMRDLQSEPHQQNQNPAERRIQEVKATTNILLDRSGAPESCWLLCMTFVVYMLNRLAHDTLGGRTPLEAAFGVTPDVSVLLVFYWYQRVYYYMPDAKFPKSKERLGRIVGIAENVGDALTFLVLTDDTNQVIARSVLRPADDDANPNKRSSTDGGGETESKSTVFSASDPIDPSVLKLPNIRPEDLIGKTFLRQREVDGARHRAEVLKRIKDVDDGIEQFLVSFGDGQREEIMTYNAVIDQLKKQARIEQEHGEDELFYSFRSIEGHRQNPARKTWEIRVLWEDKTETWEPLAEFWRSDPITVAVYAKEHGLLDTPGWKRLKPYVKNNKKVNRMTKQAILSSMRHAARYKFGVQVPATPREAMELDKKNGNTLWKDAIKKELDQLNEYKTFSSRGKGTRVPNDYQLIKVHFVSDVKHDLRHKARLVAGGHLTTVPKDTTYSSVASLRSMRLMMFIAELNGLELNAGDVGNAYLEAYTKEKVCFYAGPEFGELEGHLLVIVKALYGLKTSGARYYERSAETLYGLGFVPSKADKDVWMKDCGDHYEYICTWVDDLLHAGKRGTGFFDDLKELGFKLKGVGTPTYHLGGDLKRVEVPEKMLTWGATTYVNKMLGQYKQLFGVDVPKREVHAPLEPGDHPEVDESPLLEGKMVSVYLTMIGAMQWAVALGRIDIYCATMTMARFRSAPRQGHLDRLKRVYSYLRNYKKTAIKFNTEVPDYARFKTKNQEWGHIYHPCEEAIPDDMPKAYGKPVRITTFVDANLLHDKVTGRSATGIIHLVNKTPIDWYSKRQNTVETATYGSEFVAARIAVDQIVDLRYSLRMLGVPIDGPAWLFGDNLSVVNSSTIPSGQLKKRHNILSYHRVREAQAAKIVNFVHIDGKYNPADVLTKHMSSREWYELMKPLIFWRSREDEKQEKTGQTHRREGSVTGESRLVTEESRNRRTEGTSG